MRAIRVTEKQTESTPASKHTSIPVSGGKGKPAWDKRHLVAAITAAVAAYIDTEKQTPAVFPDSSHKLASLRLLPGKQSMPDRGAR